MVGQSGSRSALKRRRSALPLSREAVAQTPGEAAGSLLRVGSEIGHLVRRERVVRRKVVPHGGSVLHFRERAARFLRRLCATASRDLDSPPARFVTPALDEVGAWQPINRGRVSQLL
jgi:hypothetical protein